MSEETNTLEDVLSEEETEQERLERLEFEEQERLECEFREREAQKELENEPSIQEPEIQDDEEDTEQSLREHIEYLNSFPETTVFYKDIIEKDGYKVLAGTIRTPGGAEKNNILNNHMDISELSVVLENGVEKYYLKGYEKPEPSEIEKMTAYAKAIEMQVDAHLQELSSSRGYDDVKSCVGYYNSTDETFQREARAMTVYRDHLYRTCYNIMDQCQKGEIDYRTVTLEYILSLIEPIDW